MLTKEITRVHLSARDGHEGVVEILLIRDCFNSDKQNKGDQAAQDGCRKCLHGIAPCRLQIHYFGISWCDLKIFPPLLPFLF